MFGRVGVGEFDFFVFNSGSECDRFFGFGYVVGGCYGR